jgi:N4-gp56 family major capsid protein
MSDIINKLTTGNNAGELGGLLNKQQCDEAMLTQLMPRLRAYNYGQKSTLKKNDGTKVFFLGFDDIGDVKNVTEGITPDADELKPYEIEVEVFQRAKGIKFTDRLLERGRIKCQAVAIKQLARKGAEAIDSEIYDALISETCKVYGSNGKTIVNEWNSTTHKSTQLSAAALAGTDVLKDSDIDNAVTYLADKDAPRFSNGLYVGLIDAVTSTDIQNLDGFQKTTQSQDKEKVYNGVLGTYKGVLWVESNNIPKSVVYVPKTLANGDSLVGFYARTGSSAPYTYTKQTSGTWATGGSTYYEAVEVHNSFIFGDEAYGVVDVEGEGSRGKPKMISKSLGSAGTDDWADQRASEAIKYEFASKVLAHADATPSDTKDQKIVRLVSRSSIVL